MRELNFTPSAENTDVFQSYIFSNGRYRLTITQARLVLRLVEIAQMEVKGKIIGRELRQWEHSLNGVRVTMPIKSIMAEDSHHYAEAKEAVLGMLSTVCSLWDNSGQFWRATGLISEVRIYPKKGLLSFEVPDFVWDNILNFSKGYRKYELGKALQLKSPHSIRMYTLLSGQSSPLTYTIEQLKNLFGVEGKYDQTHDLVKKILIPCQKELEAVCPWSFTWSYVKVGRRIQSITLKPYPIPINRDPKLEKARLVAAAATQPFLGQIYTYLTTQMGFSLTELKPHKELLYNLQQHHPQSLEFLAGINGRRRTKDGRDRGKAWLIGAIRSEVAALMERER